MISDGVLALERSGALDHEHQVVTSFIGGSEELYKWADGNRRLRMFRTETTNDPGKIAINPMMISINAAVQIDLFAQANASYVGGRILSGFGGQTGLIGGALRSAGRQAVVGLPSWHEKSKTSTVVPLLDMPATSFQHSVVRSEEHTSELQS